jgi:hypothetical protein
MLDIAHAFDRTRVRVEEADMGVGTTGPQGRCDVEGVAVPGPRGGGAAGRGVRTRPAGTRPARPADVWGPVRPAGRRGPAALPAVRPRVAGGGAGGVVGAGGVAVRPVAVPPAVARRRRVVAAAVLGVVLGVLLGVLVALASPAGGAAGAPVPAGTTVAVVGAGESLSDVAARVAQGADAGAMVVRIRELNGLEGADGSEVAPGRPLVVPAPAVAG